MKIKVKHKDLVSTVQEISTRLKEGRINFGQATDHVESIPKSIFDDHNARTRVDAPRATAGAGIKFFDPSDAAARGGGPRFSDGDIVQKAYEAVVQAEPGDMTLDQIADKDSRRELERFHDLHDAFTLMKAMNPFFDPRRSKHFAQYGRLATKLVSKVAGENVQKIMTTGGSGTGLEFIPNTLSGSLVPFFRQELVLATAFPHINMPTSPYILPLEGADVMPYLVAEASSDNPTSSATAIPARTPATAKVTLTAKALKVRGVVSTEAEEDAIISEVGYIRSKLGGAIAFGVEDNILNGDVNTIHQDADSNATGDYRHAWDGIRKLTASGQKKSAANAALTVSLILNPLTGFGKFGQRPSDTVVVVGSKGLIHLVGDTNFNRYDAHGGTPPIVTGQIGDVYGRPVMVSAYCREDVNYAGLYDGSDTNHMLAYVIHRPSFALGDRRQITIEAMKDIQDDKFILVSTWRGTFARIQAESTSPQTSRNCGFIYNIKGNATF